MTLGNMTGSRAVYGLQRPGRYRWYGGVCREGTYGPTYQVAIYTLQMAIYTLQMAIWTHIDPRMAIWTHIDPRMAIYDPY